MATALTFPYTTAGTYTWQCPLDVTSVLVSAIGGGGGGGGVGTPSTGSGGGGAGGGAVYNTALAVTPGTTYTIVVGAGGTAGGTGGTGGSTTFGGSLFVAGGGGGGGIGTGGAGGTAGTAGSNTPGTGGTGWTGGAGAAGIGTTTTGSAGGGGAGTGGSGSAGSGATGGGGGTNSYGALGFAGSAGGNYGAMGTAYGGGGGGVRRTTSGTTAGFAGAGGAFFLQFATNYPIVIQQALSGAFSSAVTTGSTVIAFAQGGTNYITSWGNANISAITLGGVAGTKVAGASQSYSAGTSTDLECFVWQNVSGSPTIISATGGGYATFVAFEVANAGTLTTGQIASGTSTTGSITPASVTAGQLVIVALANLSNGNTTNPSSPYGGKLNTGTTGNTPSAYFYSAAITTTYAASTTYGLSNLWAAAAISVNVAVASTTANFFPFF